MDVTNITSLLILSSTLKVMTILIISGVLIYFGYRLFYLSESKSSDLQVESQFGKLKLVKATPGVFLTLFGSTILIVALTKGASLEFPAVPNAGVNGLGASAAPFNISLQSMSSENERVRNSICASKTSWALNQIRSSDAYQKSSDIPRRVFDENLTELEAVMAGCVDSVLGPGSYQAFASLQKKRDGGDTSGAPPDQEKLFKNVSSMLSP